MDVNVTSLQERAKVEATSYLEQLLSEGARKLLQAAIENELKIPTRQLASGDGAAALDRSAQDLLQLGLDPLVGWMANAGA